MSYVYMQTESAPYSVWTVGFYDKSGKWEPESDHDSREAAAKRVHYLNGERETESLKIYVKNQTGDTIDFCCGEDEYTLGPDKVVDVAVKDEDCLYIDEIR